MDLVDEHGNTIDQMLLAIQEGDLEQIQFLEALGIDLTEEQFIHCSVLHEQLHLIAYQVSKGADVDRLIEIANYRDKPVISQWAKCWKSVNALSEKLPPNHNEPKNKKSKI
ncbi:hypothetical protein [Burkholderia contaminans]|nr:hypothetical protein [Burkholderia contaminans]